MEHEPIDHKQAVISAHKSFFDSIDSLELDQRAETFVEILKKYGVGRFALNHGFLVKTSEDEPEFIGIENIVTLDWDEIYLYERQKDALFKNTKAFVEGYSSQNALLVGGSGTGKSTSVKTVAKLFAQEGLRLVQMQKGQLIFLPKVLSLIKNQGFRFILFIDDLSFEANEDEYKFLKSFIEGSISDDLSHVVFYVTSNRRHLIKEIRTERENDIHLQDFIQEMTSLSDRFGLTLIYENLDQKEYFSMVKAMAEKEGLSIEEEQLIHDARIYAMRHGKMSGRVANQFIKQVKLDAQTT
jgi:predicted AAA+ superfamily ATPase